MNLKTTHRIIGIFICSFIAIHLFNHSLSYFGADVHIEFMNAFRIIYRNKFVEFILLIAICLQISIGIRLSMLQYKNAKSFVDKAKVYSGWYIAIFFIIHIAAILTARVLLDLDTNFYFGVAGLNTFPLNLFFIPYYFFAVLALFVHIAAIHRHKMKHTILYLSPYKQSALLLAFGIVFACFLIYSLTNKFQGLNIPINYQMIK